MPSYVFRRPSDFQRIAARKLKSRVPLGKAIPQVAPPLPPRKSPIDFQYFAQAKEATRQQITRRETLIRFNKRIIPLAKRPPISPAPPKVPLKTNRPHRYIDPPEFDYRALTRRLKRRTIPITIRTSIANPPPLRSLRPIFLQHAELFKEAQYNYQLNARRLKSGWSFIPIASKKYQHISVESLIEIPEYITLIELPEYITLTGIPEYKTTRSLL